MERTREQKRIAKELKRRQRLSEQGKPAHQKVTKKPKAVRMAARLITPPKPKKTLADVARETLLVLTVTLAVCIVVYLAVTG